jgi:hypothetical protein
MLLMNAGSGVLVCCSDRLERGQAPLPDLFYSQLPKSSHGNVNQKIEQVRKRGLPPLVEKYQQHTNTPLPERTSARRLA